MAIQFANNASSTLAVGITAGSTSIQVADSSAFPQPTGGDFIYITLEDPAGDVEIVRCSANDGVNTFTVDTGGRGVDGTTAQAFNATETRVELRLVKTVMEAFLQTTGGSLTGNLDLNTNNLIDAVLTGPGTQIAAGEIVGVPLRNASGVSANEIAVPVSPGRATVGGAAILASGDDIVAELDNAGTITLNSATVGVVIPASAFLRVEGGTTAEFFQVAHDDTDVNVTTGNATNINIDTAIELSGNLNLLDNQLSRTEHIDYSVSEQTVAISLNALTIDYTLGSYVNVTVDQNLDSITINNVPTSGVASLRLKLVQNGIGGFTIDPWTGSGILFPLPPVHSTAANAVDFVDLWTDDGGSTWYAVMDQNWLAQ